MPETPLPQPKHTLAEDAMALVFATLFVSIGLVFYTKAQILTGSTAGIALLLQYASGIPFGTSFVLVNLPFIALALFRMGWPFTLRTFAAVALISTMTHFVPRWVQVAEIAPLFAAIAGGALQGVGLLILFRHRTGLGGVNVLAMFLQERFGLRAGWVQLGIDITIMAVALAYLPWENVALSVIGAVVLNVVLGVNHKPGRYVAVS